MAMLVITRWYSQIFQNFLISMDWFKGKFTGTPPYLMVKTIVSCRFSLKPIHFSDHYWLLKKRWAQVRPACGRPRAERAESSAPAHWLSGLPGQTTWARHGNNLGPQKWLEKWRENLVNWKDSMEDIWKIWKRCSGLEWTWMNFNGLGHGEAYWCWYGVIMSAVHRQRCVGREEHNTLGSF